MVSEQVEYLTLGISSDTTSLIKESSNHLLVHVNPKKLSRMSHMQGNLHVWFWQGFPEVFNNLASAGRWCTSPNYCPFILK